MIPGYQRSNISVTALSWRKIHLCALAFSFPGMTTLCHFGQFCTEACPQERGSMAHSSFNTLLSFVHIRPGQITAIVFVVLFPASWIFLQVSPNFLLLFTWHMHNTNNGCRVARESLLHSTVGSSSFCHRVLNSILHCLRIHRNGLQENLITKDDFVWC